MKRVEIASWINLTSMIGGTSVNFIVEVGFEPKLVDISLNISNVITFNFSFFTWFL